MSRTTLLTSIRFPSEYDVVWVVAGLLVAALFFSALVLAACMAVDYYESGGRAKRDHEGL